MVENVFYSGQRFNQHTILDAGKGQIAGRIGEAAFAKEYLLNTDTTAPSLLWVGSRGPGHDFEIHFPDRGVVTVDVKTKERTVPPRPDYDLHVTKNQINHDVDVYVFASMNRMNSNHVDLVGWCTKRWDWENASNVKKGELDETGKAELADAAKMKHHQIAPMSTFWRRLIDCFNG